MRQAVLYFANWNLNRRPARKGEVCALPWDCATYLNHAFWALEPAEGKQESSFARRAAKKTRGLPGASSLCTRSATRMTHRPA